MTALFASWSSRSQIAARARVSVFAREIALENNRRTPTKRVVDSQHYMMYSGKNSTPKCFQYSAAEGAAKALQPPACEAESPPAAQALQPPAAQALQPSHLYKATL